MENIKDITEANNADKGIVKGKNKILTHRIDAFLEECRVQKQFFSGQMSIEEFIGMKKKAPK